MPQSNLTIIGEGQFALWVPADHDSQGKIFASLEPNLRHWKAAFVHGDDGRLLRP